MKRIENYFKDRQSSNSSKNIDIQSLEPYIGPRSFNRNLKDQKRFFGRDYETEEIVSLISSHKLVLIYAQSGAGKTSIFNAQVIPTLEEAGFEVLPVIRLKSSNIIPNLDKNDIKNTYIFNSLQSLKPDLDPNILKDKSLQEFLEEYFPLKKDNNNREMQQLLIYDQLEEIFDILPRNWKEQRKEFFKEIVQALNNIIPLQIVFIIREDYLAQLDPYSNMLPEKLRPRFRLERLRADSALLAIRGPLKNVPKDIIQNYKGDIDKDINNIVHELMKIQIEYLPGKTEQIDDEFIEPIHLQVVLKRWWKKVTNPNSRLVKQNIIYISDVDTALEEFYEDAINDVINKGKIKESYIRRWCEENLITQTSTRSIVYKGLDSTAGLKNNLIDILQQKYFIKENHRAGARWCELGHDRLIKPIISSNQKWKKEQQKRKKSNIVKISIPIIISIIVIFVIFENLYLIPPVESFSVGDRPYILSVDQNSGLVYVTNPKLDTISVIDGKKNDLVKTIKVADEPLDIVVNSQNNLFYVTHPNINNISVIQGGNLMHILNPFNKQITINQGVFDNKIKSISLNYSPFSLGLDSVHSKLYVTSPNNISVIDTNTNKILETIKVKFTPYEIFVDMQSNKVYVPDSAGNTVSVIDGTNYKVLKTITVGKNPNSIAFNPNDNKVYVANKGDNTVSVIDGRNNNDIVVAIFEVGNNPTSVNINEGQNIFYVVNNGDNTVTAIDMGNNLMSHTLIKNIANLFMGSNPSELNINKIPVGSHPSGIAIDYDDDNNQLLYVANTDSDTVSVIDGTKKEIKEQFKVGHKPRDIAIHTENNIMYVSNSMSNTVNIIDLENKSIKNITTEGKYPVGLAVNERTNLVYVANTDSNTVSVINGTTNKVDSTIKVGNSPSGVAVDANKNLVYVTNYRDGSLSVINGTTNKVDSTIKIGNTPSGVAVDANKNLVYVTNYRDDTISVIDALDQKNLGNINISRDFPGNGPTAIAVDSNNNLIYVLNMFTDNISVIDTDLITDSIDPYQKYVTIVISAGDSPTDISLDSEKLYVTNRINNIANILNIPIVNK
ncbi:MAG: repeat-containing protein [Nitrososphaeraceae archaeon]|nr:repeat-containing protein [Nitrososphaeraceae archaeon]